MAASIARRFSRDGKLFAFVNSQGKFVTYDVEKSSVAQIYTPNLHLNVPCTCFTWVQLQIQGQSAKKKKRSSSGGGGGAAGQTMVAFGTSKGGVALYNPATAQIEKSFKGTGHTGAIAGICSEGGSLFTAGNDGKVIEWSLADCEQKKVHNLGFEKLTSLAATQQGETILAGSKQLKLWDTTKGKMVRQLVGHTSNIMLVEVVNDLDGAIYALTGSTNDRNVSLWALEGDEKIPAGLFSLDDAPESISARMEENTLHLLVVAKSGMAHYFAKDLNKINASKPVKPTHTFEVAQDTKGTGSKVVSRLPIFAASLEFSANLPKVLIAYGSELGLKFEQLTEETVKGQKQVVIVREPSASFQRKEQEELQLKTRTPAVDKATVEFLNPVNAGKKALKTVEIPMEDRLENLALTGDGGDVKSAGISQKNMAHLLLQGLHSKDAEILRSVFSRNEPELIQRTAERIPAQYISALLGEISTLMQQKTVHVATAVCWLKALIHSHTSQLMALGPENLLANFSTCLGIIEYRVQHANSLSKLSGRLDLLVNQLDRTERLAKNPEELVNAQALVYHEDDESDVDSVLGKGGEGGGQGESSVDDDSDDGAEEDDDDGEADETVGSILRLRNGSMEEDPDDEEEAGAEQSAEGSASSEDDDDEEMDVSD
uniref:Small-subunit processome Utp12 domain-containing protein n=1 Tax=Culex tarsalis TaxID=7177 RepID=A0A1Q3EY68_CULTA